MTHIKSLMTLYFRSYDMLSLPDVGARNVILCGANGAGKTNILEALSLLAPGRGLRGAKVAEIQNHKKPASAGWSLTTDIETVHGTAQIGSGRDLANDRRIVRINGETAKSQTALGEWLSCLWLTPQMDRLFIDEKSARRKFFDRLIYTFDPGHLGRLTRYENAMRQRLKLLKEGRSDPTWLSGIEVQMAETALALCAARQEFCQKLQQAYARATQEEQVHFPQALLLIEGQVESVLGQKSALEAEDWLRHEYETSRKQDAQSGSTSFGPHRSDFQVYYIEKEMPAAQSSTGEQKALLIGIILAHARLVEEERGSAPVLLLDEVVAHLDPSRRQILSNVLTGYTSQVWMTGTDQALFSDFRDHSRLYEVCDSTIAATGF